MISWRTLDISYLKFIDYFLQKTLRKKYKRISNQRERTKYFYKYYGYLIDKYKESPILTKKNTGPIWFFWWQGTETMPPIVKKCYKLALIHAPKNHPVTLLTEKNFKDYVDIPPHVIDKVYNKTITLTHFSDILRVSLLAKHGGLWMDATIYTTGPIKAEIFEQPFFSIRIPDDGQYVSKCLWTGFFMGAPKGHPLYHFMQDLFFDYWKDHNELLDYFLIDLGIRMAYDNIPQIKQSIDDGVWFTDKLFFFQSNIGKPFNQNDYESTTSEWSYFKVTYRDYFGALVEKDKLGRETYYKHLLNLSL